MFVTKKKWSLLLQLARLHYPLPILFLYLPCLWGLVLFEKINFLKVHANSNNIHIILQWVMGRGGDFLNHAFLMGIGAVAARSAGCIFNDMCDVSFDQKVARTKNRPLAEGSLSRKDAWVAFIAFLSIAGLVWLLLPMAAKFMSIVGLFLLFLYPYAKRFLKIPQIILGFAFNMGIPVSIAFMDSTLLLMPHVWLLYGVGIFWTLYYDTIYALQDIQDDRSLGIGSSALFFENYIKLALSLFYICMTAFMAILGYCLQADVWFYLALLGGIAWDVGFEIRRFDPHNPKKAKHLFHYAILLGIGILFLI